MAKHYHVDIAAFAAGTDRKWVDNLLSHFDVPGVDAARQGVARHISVEGICHVALTRSLWRDLGLPLEAALDLALRLLAGDAEGVTIDDSLELRLDRHRFFSGIDRKIAEGVESVVPRRRGRPPHQRRATADNEKRRP